MTGNIRRTKLIARGTEPLTRRSRDVYLVVVATEDTYAAKQYLDALQDRGLVDRGRVEIIPLPTTDSRSSLSALLDRLKAHRDALDVRLPQDEYWAVFDIDHHQPAELAAAVQIAKSRGYGLAGSNPCFELWLLLHLTDDTTGITAAPDNRRAARECEERLHETLQAGDPRARGYDEARIGPERFAVPERVRDACSRARALMPAAPGPWPSRVGTHVHILIERLPAPAAALPG